MINTPHTPSSSPPPHSPPQPYLNLNLHITPCAPYVTPCAPIFLQGPWIIEVPVSVEVLVFVLVFVFVCKLINCLIQLTPLI